MRKTAGSIFDIQACRLLHLHAERTWYQGGSIGRLKNKTPKLGYMYCNSQNKLFDLHSKPRCNPKPPAIDLIPSPGLKIHQTPKTPRKFRCPDPIKPYLRGVVQFSWHSGASKRATERPNQARTPPRLGVREYKISIYSLSMCVSVNTPKLRMISVLGLIWDC